MPRDVVASCRDLVKTYYNETGRVRALRGIDLEFHGSALTAVVGPSGSGKSSLLRLLAALDRPTSGVVRVGDAVVSSATEAELRAIRRLRVGYVFQRPSDNFVPYLTVREHLALAASAAGFAARDRDGVLDDLGIGGRADHRPMELSGGEQQRAALAQILVAGPRLIVADEPTAELDSRSARDALTIMSDLARDGIALILATHDPNVTKAADEIIELHHGVVGEHVPEPILEESAALSPDDPDAPWRRPGSTPPPRAPASERSGGAALARAPVHAGLLEARALSKTYLRGDEAVHALRAVELELGPGEVVGLVGRSGSGKTTLLNVLAGWEIADDGDIAWAEPPAGGPLPRWRDVAVVPQRLGLIDELTVRENIEYPARLAGSLEHHRYAVDQLLERLSLDDLADRYPLQTSVGEQQRTALARALVLTPKLLLADEPTGHQDGANAQRVFRALRAAADRGTCCVIATHNEEVVPVLDRIMEMSDGILRAARGRRGERMAGKANR